MWRFVVVHLHQRCKVGSRSPTSLMSFWQELSRIWEQWICSNCCFVQDHPPTFGLVFRQSLPRTHRTVPLALCPSSSTEAGATTAEIAKNGPALQNHRHPRFHQRKRDEKMGLMVESSKNEAAAGVHAEFED